MTTHITPEQARELATLLDMRQIPSKENQHLSASALRSLAAQVEALTAVIVERDTIIKGLLTRVDEVSLDRDAAVKLAADRLADAERYQVIKEKNWMSYGLEATLDAILAARAAASNPPVICGNCDTALPEGCKGLFLDDGEHCRFGKAAS